ncbi:MAG: twin-arginine translocation signal domain-containing protein [Alphaproteobacteria bacterium]|nr:twin-arginine translocation signal domain-containing protein [Alphaproteobacteria bacterium]
MAKKTTSGQTGNLSKGVRGGVNRRQIIKGAGAAGLTAAALPGLVPTTTR